MFYFVFFMIVKHPVMLISVHNQLTIQENVMKKF